jgi:hypothetical protein
MAMATMPPIELDRIPCQKPLHNGGDRRKTRTQQKMRMVGYQRPCQTIGMRLNQHLAKTVYKGLTVRIVPKDFAALDSAYNDVVKRTRSINSGFSWYTNLNSRLI